MVNKVETITETEEHAKIWTVFANIVLVFHKFVSCSLSIFYMRFGKGNNFQEGEYTF